ncbi:hypothetical protein ACM1RC_08880 [Paenibacillus azoreducens]|uniref:hypothetical protein n=1 Tax=Paenibacillus azoreducens TaxID=116718 RepID=UPI0039F49DFE
MPNYIVNNRNQLYIYNGQGLFQIALKPEVQQKFKAMLGGEDAEVIEIDDTIAAKLLKGKRTESAMDGAQAAVAATMVMERDLHSKEMRYVHLGPTSGVLATCFSNENLKELRADDAAEKADPILDLYVRHFLKWSEGTADRSGHKRFLVDLQQSHIIREIQLLSDFPLVEIDVSKQGWSERQDPMEQLTRLETLESRLVHHFVPGDQTWNQIPYKIAVSTNEAYCVGESQINEIIRCSYLNLEHVLSGVYPVGKWVVCENLQQMVEKCARLLFEVVDRSEMVRYDVPFRTIKSLIGRAAVYSMIHHYIPECEETLTIEIQHHCGLDIYGITAIQSGRACTQTQYGTNPELLLNNVLQHYFALLFQNMIQVKEESELGKIIPLQMVPAYLPCGRHDLIKQALNSYFHVRELRSDIFAQANIQVVNLVEKQVQT